MNRFNVKCPECNYPLPAERYNAPDGFLICGSCRCKVMVHALPALYQRDQAAEKARDADLDDAGCFFHDSKKAEYVCSSCGRFLCELCALQMGGETLCTSCLEHRRKKPEEHQEFISRQFRHDKLALGLAVVPLIYFPLTLFTAPAALFVGFRFWKKELVLATHVRGRLIAALVFSLLEIVGWIVLFIFFIGLLIDAG